MNGLINPIKHLFRKKVEPHVPTQIEKEFKEVLTIPSEHSNHVRSPFYQDENDDDYFVYKLGKNLKCIDFNYLEPEGNKWADWGDQGKGSPYSPGYLGAQVSDTVKNSNIHVFPDRQDLVNPTLGRGYKYGDPGLQNNYFGKDLYKNDPVFNNYQATNQINAPSEDEKDPNLLKILPSYLLEDSQQNTEQNNQEDEFKGHKTNINPRASTDYQAYCNVIPQALDISNIEPKKSIDDYSAIVAPKKFRASLDDSEDLNFAQVISTLEKNIAKAKAYRHGGPKPAVSKQGLKIKLNPSNPNRKQDDTLSLDQSSAVDPNTYLGESQDLRAKFLKRDDSNRTVFYSFASTDKHTSGIALENPYTNHQNPPQNGFFNGRADRNHFIQNLPALTRIEEETVSAKTLGVNPLSPSGTEFKLSSNKNAYEPNPLARNRFSEPIVQGVKPRNAPTHLNTPPQSQPQKSHTRSGSQGMAVNFSAAKPAQKSQLSENLVLCINCNDLLPSYIADKHSIYCNETMMATEDLTSEIQLETKGPQITLERCNLRLRKLKILLDKNLRNLKGQVQLGIVILEDCDAVLSVLELIIRIAEEIIKNDKVAPKLTRDIKSIINFQEDLAPFIDIVLASIIINNIDIFIQTSKLKEKALELILKKAREDLTSPSYEYSKGSLTSKLDFEKLRFNLTTTPNKTNKPSSLSYRPPGLVENYGQSTAGGSSLASQRTMENRVPLSGDWMDAVMRSSAKKDYY